MLLPEVHLKFLNFLGQVFLYFLIIKPESNVRVSKLFHRFTQPRNPGYREAQQTSATRVYEKRNPFTSALCANFFFAIASALRVQTAPKEPVVHEQRLTIRFSLKGVKVRH